MNSTPAPPNDFAEFIETYFGRCRERVPLIEGNAGKWKFEDLIPGLSDFDMRFFVPDDLSLIMRTRDGKGFIDETDSTPTFQRCLVSPGVP